MVVWTLQQLLTWENLWSADRSHALTIPFKLKERSVLLTSSHLKLPNAVMKYSFNIFHVPGKNLNCADALSRAPKTEPTAKDCTLEEEGNLQVNYVF